MTIEKIINLLKKDGINSKQKVIDMLKNPSKEELLELRRDINERINEKNLKGETNESKL